ncbi:hypothetical protein BofuT4_uP161000.1 [Botrytis cinerea T4]|uniref:Uncharacterized protein n=1 Tax=Botryotinia fuckeliana (strain T4) TaxID=999810 RepID=G2YTQ1_BOTF4|nr:hypothetical protein BofuT4_uP161000.1 [Botrytis cinerea T4]
MFLDQFGYGLLCFRYALRTLGLRAEDTFVPDQGINVGSPVSINIAPAKILRGRKV